VALDLTLLSLSSSHSPHSSLPLFRQGSVLRVRLTHNGEVVGLEEQFDVGAEWRLMPRSDKPDRFSLHRIRPSPDGLNQISFKAETKDDGNGFPETPHTTHHTPLCLSPIDACDKASHVTLK